MSSDIQVAPNYYNNRLVIGHNGISPCHTEQGNTPKNQSFIYSPTDAPVSCLKKTILQFTLKQLRHVSVLQLHRHQGAH